MGLSGIDRETIVGNVLKAQERKRAALTEYEAAAAELAWWLEGANLAGITDMQIEDDVNAVPDDLFPPVRYFEESGERPTLRQSIMAELRERPNTAISVAELASRVAARGWIEADVAQKRVSDLAGVMHGDKQLVRVGRGVYRLHPDFALAFDRVTDSHLRSQMPPPGSWPPANG
jgi:hypothetical protein